MSGSLPERVSPAVPVQMPGDVISLFEDAHTNNEGQIVVPEHRIQLTDFSTAGTMRVQLAPYRAASPYELLGFFGDSKLVGDSLMKEAGARDKIVGWENGRPTHAYLRKVLFPTNKPGEPLERPSEETLAMGRLVRLEIQVKWDSDEEEAMGIENAIYEELGDDVFMDRDGEDSPFWVAFASRAKGRTFRHVDPQASTQPLAIGVHDRLFSSIPNQEHAIMQQGLFDTALYDGFATPEVLDSFDKLTPNAPDITEFWGSVLLVPYKLDALRDFRIGFMPLPTELAAQHAWIGHQAVLELMSGQ